MEKSKPCNCADLHGDLLVEIYPRASVIWEGTRAQLEAEGLIPPALRWPDGSGRTCWYDGRFESNLLRARPPDASTSSSAGKQGNWWRLVRYQILPIRRLHGARMYAQQCEIERAQWATTDAARRLGERYGASRRDPAFQTFKRALGINS